MLQETPIASLIIQVLGPGLFWVHTISLIANLQIVYNHKKLQIDTLLGQPDTPKPAGGARGEGEWKGEC